MENYPIIPKSEIDGLLDDIVVETLYPDIQIDIIHNKKRDIYLYLASTFYDNGVFYQYYTVQINKFFNKETELIEDLKDMVKKSVIEMI